MPVFLKQSTQVIARFGPYLDKTDGVTEETGLAGAATEISKNHAAFGAGPTLGVHDAEGWYPITLTTAHTNTVGSLLVKAHDSATHLPVWREFYVLEESVFDALFAASGATLTPASAAKLEAMLDGTGGQTLSLGRLVISGTHGTEGIVRIVNLGAGSGVQVIAPDAIQILPTVGYGIDINGGTVGIYVSGTAYDIQANIQGNLSGSVGTVTGKVTPIDVDGITFASAMEAVMAVLAGVAEPTGSTVVFKKRDGLTTKVTIVYGATDGQRTTSTYA